jgi:hypothetical protein
VDKVVVKNSSGITISGAAVVRVTGSSLDEAVTTGAAVTGDVVVEVDVDDIVLATPPTVLTNEVGVVGSIADVVVITGRVSDVKVPVVVDNEDVEVIFAAVPLVTGIGGTVAAAVGVDIV